MQLYKDIHKHIDGLSAEAVAEAHRKDLDKQSQYGVKFQSHWFNERDGTVFCLSEAPR